MLPSECVLYAGTVLVNKKLKYAAAIAVLAAAI